jgi:type II secretory pathway pseudopilin PulG
MMELVVVLAVIAILATLITPIITSYVDKAKLNKATADVLSISTALNQFNSDTKNFPIFTAPAQYPNGSVYEVLASSGLDPALATGVSVNWTTTNTGNLTQLLNENSLLITTSSSSKAAWNGPYVGVIGEDPWGTKYVVTSRALKAGSGLTAFVLSAGPNRTIETALDQTRGSAFTIGGDDIVSIVR